MRGWDVSFSRELLAASSYRHFLKCFFLPRGPEARPRPLSFREFSTRAGFASKSFLSDIIAGRKKITPGAFEKVAVGLKLSKVWTHHLRLLVCLEEESFRTRNLEAEDLLLQLQKSRNLINKSLLSKTVSERSPVLDLFIKNDIAEIFAALGTMEVGATLSSIAQRVNLKVTEVKPILESLIETGIVSHDTTSDHYKPSALAFDAISLKDHETFQADVFRALEKVKKRFRTQSNSEKSLFMVQTFSLESNKLPEFKRKLAELIEDFAIAAEDPEGDTIGEILIGFTNSTS